MGPGGKSLKKNTFFSSSVEQIRLIVLSGLLQPGLMFASKAYKSACNLH